MAQFRASARGRTPDQMAKVLQGVCQVRRPRRMQNACQNEIPCTIRAIGKWLARSVPSLAADGISKKRARFCGANCACGLHFRGAGIADRPLHRAAAQPDYFENSEKRRKSEGGREVQVPLPGPVRALPQHQRNLASRATTPSNSGRRPTPRWQRQPRAACRGVRVL